MLHTESREETFSELREMVRSVRLWIAVLLLAILSCCLIWRSCTAKEQNELPPLNYSESTSSAAVNTGAEATAAVTATTEKAAAAPAEAAEEYRPSASEPLLSRSKAEEITAKVQELHSSFPDFIGWLYMADSDIDYPVVQGTDNEYYLSHALNGSYYRSGTLFLDWRCSRDLSDGTNIIFGHNMQSGMFGDIRSYRDPAAFEAHRYGWFFTPDKVYLIEFFALSVVSGFDALYDVPCDLSQWYDGLLEAAEFKRDAAITDKLIAFSTCASDYDNARALFAGVLTAQESIEDCICPEK